MTDSGFSFLSHPSLYLVPISYLMGSIPFGVLAVKSRGIDLQSVGSGNIGTTNVLRSAGRKAAIITLIGDSLKGAAAVMLGRIMIGGEIWEGIMGLSAVLGHLYPIFLSFRGGKGVATGFGVLVIYNPFPALISIIVWILTAVFTKYASIAALMAFVSLPVISIFFDISKTKISFAILLAFLIILKHRDNIKKLITGTEQKIGDKIKG